MLKKILLAIAISVLPFSGAWSGAGHIPKTGDSASLQLAAAAGDQQPLPEIKVSEPVRNHAIYNRSILIGSSLSPAFSDKNRERYLLRLLEDIALGHQLQFPRDGIIFMNKEGILPKNQAWNYYREYTVLPRRENPYGNEYLMIGTMRYTVTPMQGKRGPERLVIGGNREVYYSPDHYRTFVKINAVP